MNLGMVGLGRMGANMTERLLGGGHKVHCYDRDAAAVARMTERGAKPTSSLEALVAELPPARIVWIMVPAGQAVDSTIDGILPLLKPGDILIDGGNSNYRDSIRRAERTRGYGVHFIDVGTSGGIWGLKEGYSLMIGGEREIVERLAPIFRTLAPTPDRGWGYVGPSGSGHFVKMIHNGIEYGMMEALAEGFSILQKKKEFSIDVARVAEIWRYGSVVRSWLLDLTANALSEDAELSTIAPFVEDSGEGRWTAFEAIDLGVPAPVITTALIERLRSRDADSFADRLLAAMRHEFGGHAVKREGAA